MKPTEIAELCRLFVLMVETNEKVARNTRRLRRDIKRFPGSAEALEAARERVSAAKHERIEAFKQAGAAALAFGLIK